MKNPNGLGVGKTTKGRGKRAMGGGNDNKRKLLIRIHGGLDERSLKEKVTREKQHERKKRKDNRKAVFSKKSK